MDSSKFSSRTCLIEEDNGMAYLADLEAGLLVSNNWQCHKQNGSFLMSKAKLYVTKFGERKPHFLDACFLCKRPLSSNEQIFMYRGDTPFCSVECRFKQIVTDEVNEMKLQRSASLKALRNKDQMKSASFSTGKAHGYNFYTSSTIAAA